MIIISNISRAPTPLTRRSAMNRWNEEQSYDDEELTDEERGAPEREPYVREPVRSDPSYRPSMEEYPRDGLEIE